MITVEFDKRQLNALSKKIEKLANVDKVARKEILSSARQIAQIYVKAARGAIQDYPRDIVVVRKSGTKITIPKGTLRRSMGTWTPKNSKSHIAAGPRAGQFRKLTENRDGWFAHFVEYGNFPEAFGGNRRTRNTGVFARTISQTSPAMRREMINAMNKIIQNQARK